MEKRMYVGVDVSKHSLEVAVVWPQAVGQAMGQYDNDVAGYEQLATDLSNQGATVAHEVHVVLEATGGYELGVVAYAYEQGWQVCLPNPKLVRDWAKGSGRRAKTDRQDALMLAQFGAEKQPAPQDDLPPEVRELDDLLRRRTDLEEQRSRERNRLLGYRQRPHPSSAVLESLQRSLESLEEELARVEQAIQELIQNHPPLKNHLKQLRTVPGIGERLVLPILVLLYRWRARTQGEGTAKGLVAFLGLDPQPYESGRSVSRRATISRMGDRSLRSLLYMGALGGIRGRNALHVFYHRLVSRGKPKRLALVAAARKILTWAWVIFQTNTNFDPSRHLLTET